ncbi:MAG: hypothetical protein ACKO23_10395 [Gemmataceae bacterium]
MLGGMEMLNMMFGGSGRNWIEAALLLGLFWAALSHPERIRSLVKFRLSTLLLGISVISPIFVQLFLFARMDTGVSQGIARQPGLAQESMVRILSMAIPPGLLMVAILLGVDSITPRARPKNTDQSAAQDRQGI